LKTPDRQEGRRKFLEDEVFGTFGETFGNDLGVERVGEDLVQSLNTRLIVMHDRT
jgi:hypothetical protein